MLVATVREVGNQSTSFIVWLKAGHAANVYDDIMICRLDYQPEFELAVNIRSEP